MWCASIPRTLDRTESGAHFAISVSWITETLPTEYCACYVTSYIFELYNLINVSFPDLRTFASIAIAYPYCARKFACHVMHRASALRTEMNNDRADDTAIALLGFSNLGGSVTPLFFSEQILFTIISTLSKNEQKSQCRKFKENQDICPRDMESCHLAAAKSVNATFWARTSRKTITGSSGCCCNLPTAKRFK